MVMEYQKWLSKQPRTAHRAPDVDERLVQVGLPSRALWDMVLQSAEDAAWSWTPHYPRVYFGEKIWGEVTGALRFLTVPFGWTIAEPKNQPLAVSPSGKLAITVANADAATGLVGPPYPRTRAQKGKQTREATAQNQASFFDVGPDLAPAARQTWYLLIFADRATRTLRAEISLPLGMHFNGHVSWWAERILLPPVAPTDPSQMAVSTPSPRYDYPHIAEVSVERSPAWQRKGPSTRSA